MLAQASRIILIVIYGPERFLLRSARIVPLHSSFGNEVFARLAAMVRGKVPLASLMLQSFYVDIDVPFGELFQGG